MNFLKIVEEIQKEEGNKGKLVMVKCGVFFVGIGKDAIALNKILGLKLTCIKKGICKAGLPVNSMLKYLDILEKKQYNVVVYDYNKTTQKYIKKFTLELGKEIEEESRCLDCKNCDYYKNHKEYEEIDIFSLLKNREKKEEEEKDE